MLIIAARHRLYIASLFLVGKTPNAPPPESEFLDAATFRSRRADSIRHTLLALRFTIAAAPRQAAIEYCCRRDTFSTIALHSLKSSRHYLIYGRRLAFLNTAVTLSLLTPSHFHCYRRTPRDASIR